MDNPIEYYRARERQARANASGGLNPALREIQLQLAEFYRMKAEVAEGAGRKPK